MHGRARSQKLLPLQKQPQPGSRSAVVPCGREASRGAVREEKLKCEGPHNSTRWPLSGTSCTGLTAVGLLHPSGVGTGRYLMAVTALVVSWVCWALKRPFKGHYVHLMGCILETLLQRITKEGSLGVRISKSHHWDGFRESPLPPALLLSTRDTSSAANRNFPLANRDNSVLV